jgi:hypothetical protein
MFLFNKKGRRGVLILVPTHQRMIPQTFNLGSSVKNPSAVMPDLIRHPEPLEFTGFRLVRVIIMIVPG